MLKKSNQIIASTIFGILFFLAPATAFAHVVVTPDKVNVGQELVFNISVPNEKQVAVKGLKLDIPNDVTDVTPTAKEGWTITSTKSKADDPQVTSISWSGNIPVGQRQDFSFSAQVPGKTSELDWKAYQIYANGTAVNWDQKPAGSDDANGSSGPYSVTQVVNDLVSSSPNISADNNEIGSYVLAGVALLMSIAALVIKRK